MSPVSQIDLLAPLLEDAPDISALANQQVWSTIRQHAGSYGVAALIAYAVRPHVTGEDRQWCDRILTESWVRHERMLGCLENLLRLFDANGIPVIALKGPLLARRYYKPAFLRKPSMDLDLAVSAQYLDRACKVLASEGYAPSKPIRDALSDSHHVELDKPSQPRLELHFRLSHRALGIAVDELFERAVSVSLPNGRKALVLGAADQLLHLILHLTQSRFGTLFHLFEVRRVCRAETSDVLAEAISRGVRHHYCGALRMMDIAFRTRWKEPFLVPGTNIPKTWLNSRLTPELFRAFESWSLPGRDLHLADRIYGRWLDFQLTDRPRDALRSAAYFLATAKSSVGQSRAWGSVKRLRFAHDSPISHTEVESRRHPASTGMNS